MKIRPGKTDEWYTPKYIFKALGVKFDLDPCGSFKDYVPTKRWFIEDGLEKVWSGRIWLNPPFGGRNGYFPWVQRFIEHGNGIGLITSLTSSEGFHKFIPQMDAILFPKGKTRFIDQGGKEGKCPFTGVVLFAIGKENCIALKKSKLGIYIKLT